MNTQRTLREARTMVTALRGLAEPAPRSLSGRVLAEVGIGDHYAEVPGPIGPLLVAWGPDGITAVERSGDEMGFELSYSLQFGRQLTRVQSVPESMKHKLEARFAGERVEGPAVDLSHLTAFGRAVLHKTMEIPRGEVRPYAWVAREIGRPKAVRAVGSALANNPIPFVIPCHRVVRTDGHIGEYGAGGPEAKKEVLAVEGVDAGELERLASSGVRYFGSDTTKIFCFPSCRNARRVSQKHLVTFRTSDHAHAAGYRACKVCRPLEGAVFAA